MLIVTTIGNVSCLLDLMLIVTDGECDIGTW